jgi:hypothetical protein
MYLVPIAWMYIVILMTVAEATSPRGTVLGAAFTFLLYGLLPLSIVMYVLRTRARRRLRLAREAQEAAPHDLPSADTFDPDGGGHAAGDAVAAERKEP